MIFNSLEFLFVFLPITYVVFWSLATPNARYIWLTITGYIFYGWWNPKFCLLIAFSTLISYLAGLGFLRWKTGGLRKYCLLVPIMVDLILLGFFKYTNFLLESFDSLQPVFNLNLKVPRYDIILPVGISFYTFHTISYIVDCYRNKIQPTKNLFEFAAYVSLFSQLVAGPIVRFSQLEEDLRRLDQADRLTLIPRGLALFLTGLVEKVVIADSIAFLIDSPIEEIRSMSTLGCWELLVAYSMQLYYDFSGYSTMSMGLGLLFGMRIPVNFNSPYKAIDLGDFWRRWHISLSMCMRDYLYIPLGGNRHGELRTYLNLLLTMLIGGVWHGANMTFVVWGLWHGLWLCFFRFWNPEPTKWLNKLVGWFITLMVVMIGWVWFRSPNITHANDWLAGLFSPRSGLLPANQVYLVCFLIISWTLALRCKNPVEFHNPKDGWVYPIWLATIVSAIVLALIVGWGNSPFLYFQF
jgi:alginate O-acetyltransferase complex protein AlgI